MLNIVHYTTPSDTPPLLIVHGLYGSARNWGVIAKRLSDTRTVWAVDQRNHGESGWYDSHTYFDMAQDLAQVIEKYGKPMDILGHSMGGKAAMVLAVQRPDLVNRLVIADIAPVPYTHDQSKYIQAMKSLDLSIIEKRSDAAQALAQMVPDPALQSFFTQSLDIANKRWKLNLDILGRDMHHVIGFPELNGTYNGATLFLSGGQSDYVLPEYRPEIKRLFPKARFAKIPGAGHWLHAESPREFEQSVRVFLS